MSSMELEKRRQIVCQKLAQSLQCNATKNEFEKLHIKSDEIIKQCQFPIEVLVNIFRHVDNAKTLLRLKMVDKRFNAIVNEFAEQFVKLNINEGITVRAKVQRKTNNDEIKARDRNSYQIYVFVGNGGGGRLCSICVHIDRLEHIFRNLRICGSVKLRNTDLSDAMLAKFCALDYGPIERLKIIGDLRRMELSESSLSAFIARVNPSVKLSIRGAFPERLITDRMLASAPLAYRLAVYHLATIDDINNPDYTKRLPCITDETLMRFVHLHTFHVVDESRVHSLVLPNAAITASGIARFVQAWTDINNTENDHITKPIYINMHLEQALSTNLVQQLAILLQPHIIIDDEHSMETRRPRIELTYTQNYKSVKIDLVRFVKLECEREKYIATKSIREQERKDVLKEKKKPSISIFG